MTRVVHIDRRGAPLRGRAAAGGFTLLEVLFALLLAGVGLLGTLAAQQALLGASANANDAQVALRLASRAMEELGSRRLNAGPPQVDQLRALATGAFSPSVFLDREGRASAAATPAARFRLQTRVIDGGVSQPYYLTVVVGYALDTGTPKTVRLDLERRKIW